MCCLTNQIQCGAVIQPFFPKHLQRTRHSSSTRARYGVSFVGSESDSCSALVDAVVYIISCYTGPRYKYNGILL